MKLRTKETWLGSSNKGGIVDYLLRISPNVQDIETRRQSRLLAAMLIVMTAGFGLLDLRGALTVPGYVVPWYGYVFLISSYLLNRYRSYSVAASLTVLMFPVVIFAEVLFSPSASPATTLYLSFRWIPRWRDFPIVPGACAVCFSECGGDRESPLHCSTIVSIVRSHRRSALPQYRRQLAGAADNDTSQ